MRDNYIQKFRTLAEGIVSEAEQNRFIELAENLPSLSADEVRQLNFVVDGADEITSKGIF